MGRNRGETHPLSGWRKTFRPKKPGGTATGSDWSVVVDPPKVSGEHENDAVNASKKLTIPIGSAVVAGAMVWWFEGALDAILAASITLLVIGALSLLLHLRESR